MTPAERAEVLARSRERDLYLSRILAAEAAGYRRGRADGWHDGYRDAEDSMAAAWRTLTTPIAYPERGAGRRLQCAVAGERSDALEHERHFVSRAYNTADRNRSDAQRGAVRLYPPPQTGGRR